MHNTTKCFYHCRICLYIYARNRKWECKASETIFAFMRDFFKSIAPVRLSQQRISQAQLHNWFFIFSSIVYHPSAERGKFMLTGLLNKHRALHYCTIMAMLWLRRGTIMWREREKRITITSTCATFVCDALVLGRK